MKKELIILLIGFVIFDNSIPLQAIQQPQVDEVEMMLKKIEQNLKMASQVTSVAKSAGYAILWALDVQGPLGELP